MTMSFETCLAHHDANRRIYALKALLMDIRASQPNRMDSKRWEIIDSNQPDHHQISMKETINKSPISLAFACLALCRKIQPDIANDSISSPL